MLLAYDFRRALAEGWPPLVGYAMWFDNSPMRVAPSAVILCRRHNYAVSQDDGLPYRLYPGQLVRVEHDNFGSLAGRFLENAMRATYRTPILFKTAWTSASGFHLEVSMTDPLLPRPLLTFEQLEKVVGDEDALRDLEDQTLQAAAEGRNFAAESLAISEALMEHFRPITPRTIGESILSGGDGRIDRKQDGHE